MTDTAFANARLLFVDDEAPILRSLERIMRTYDYHCEYCSSGADALDKMAEESFDVVISDMKMPDMDGAELLRQISEQYPETMRIVLSGFSEEELVMKAINEGRIWGFIHKPWDEMQLIASINQALTAQQLVAERALLKRTLARYQAQDRDHYQGFIGASTPMQGLYKMIDQAAPSNASVFITGPSGTGKEVAAEAIHNASRRADKPFIAINCAAIPGELMESEIFGHIKGAFSGAQSNRDGAATQADGGTLFLDELGEMDILLQAKLLRFIQTGLIQRVGASKQEKVDIRFICATNRPPLEAIEDGKLREDLYYRLNVISLVMPALSQRGDDPILIAEHFLQHFADSEQKSFNGFTQQAQQLLKRYPWPGNVRQLQNTIHSLVVLNDGPLLTHVQVAQVLQISDEKLTLYLGELEVPEPPQATSTQAPESSSAAFISSQLAPSTAEGQQDELIALAEVEKRTIERAIDHFDGNVVKAASALEVSPSTLYRKLQQWEKTAETA